MAELWTAGHKITHRTWASWFVRCANEEPASLSSVIAHTWEPGAPAAAGHGPPARRGLYPGSLFVKRRLQSPAGLLWQSHRQHLQRPRRCIFAMIPFHPSRGPLFESPLPPGAPAFPERTSPIWLVTNLQGKRRNLGRNTGRASWQVRVALGHFTCTIRGREVVTLGPLRRSQTPRPPRGSAPFFLLRSRKPGCRAQCRLHSGGP